MEKAVEYKHRLEKTVIRTDNPAYLMDRLETSKIMPWRHYPTIPGEKVIVQFVHEKWNGEFREHWKITILSADKAIKEYQRKVLRQFARDSKQMRSVDMRE